VGSGPIEVATIALACSSSCNTWNQTPYYQEEEGMAETINGYTKEEAIEKAFKLGFES
jgi:hypothetical protein